MIAQEWLETARKIIADCDRSKLSFQIVCNAAAIIRSQQERIHRLTAELKEREGEVGRIRKTYDSQMDILRKRVESLLLDKEFLTSNVNHAESLAASRLADQEAIERHTRKQIYRELYEIRYETDKLLCKIERECAPYIQQKYGVE